MFTITLQHLHPITIPPATALSTLSTYRNEQATTAPSHPISHAVHLQAWMMELPETAPRHRAHARRHHSPRWQNPCTMQNGGGVFNAVQYRRTSHFSSLSTAPHFIPHHLFFFAFQQQCECRGTENLVCVCVCAMWTINSKR